MRRVGVVKHARGLAAHDHVCWCYRERGEFLARAREFLADGLAAGQRARYVTADEEELAEGIDGVEIWQLRGVYPGELDVAAQARRVTAALRKALREGCTGFRVVADVTELVRTPARLAAFARYEHVVDRLMVDQPFAAMCGYDTRALGADRVARAAALHPASNLTPPFRLFARGGDGVSLAGDLDLTGRELLPFVLESADLRPVRSSLTIDASAVGFIDHRALITLGRHARARGFRDVVLRTSLRCPPRLVELLGIEGVRIERAE